jgi:hypothetical protein
MGNLWRLMVRLACAIWFGCVLCLAEVWAKDASPPDQAQLIWVFKDGLKEGWQDWGWTQREIKDKSPVSLWFKQTHTGWIVAHPEPLKEHINRLMLDIVFPASFDQKLVLQLIAEDSKTSMPELVLHHGLCAQKKSDPCHIEVDMDVLNPGDVPFNRLTIFARFSQEETPEIDTPVKLNAIAFRIGKHEDHLYKPPAGDTPIDEIALGLSCKAPLSPISPYIYGIAYDPQHNQNTSQWEIGTTIRRWGGNHTSRYNWKLGHAWNTAFDWFFMNVNYTNDDSFTWKTFLKENESHRIQAALTIPTIGYVAKDTVSGSYPEEKYGKQQAQFQGFGNGKQPNGQWIKKNNPKETSVAADVNFMRPWIQQIVQYSKKAKIRPILEYILDNEPSLWNTTHRDVHPKPLTYEELLSKTLAYSKMIRQEDPSALIAGPAEWGWPGYFYSALDAEVGFSLKPDRRQHGDVPLLDWWLRKLKAQQRKTGIRYLDIVDLHYYPQTDGVYGKGEKSDPIAAQTRIRVTRSLWDKDYTDESWIHEKIALLPRLQRIIHENFPGLRISIGEYNFGGERHISGALAQAEVLGIFAREKVFSAYYWTFPPSQSETAVAFQAYRNYDGEGSRFQDYLIASERREDFSYYLSSDLSRRRWVGIALNLNPSKPYALKSYSTIPKTKKAEEEASDESVQEEGAEEGAEGEVPPKPPQTGCERLKVHRVFQHYPGVKGLRLIDMGKNPARIILPPYSLSVIEYR